METAQTLPQSGESSVQELTKSPPPFLCIQHFLVVVYVYVFSDASWFTASARVRVRFVTIRIWRHNYIVHKALIRIMHLIQHWAC